MNANPVHQLMGATFYFSVDEMTSLMTELDSFVTEGQFLPAVLEGMRRNVNMLLGSKGNKEGS